MSLISPGIEISITDESFYDSSTPGSIPLIVIATANDKTSPSGTGIAPMSKKANAGKLFLATSQRDLIQSFGNPVFYSSGGNSLHGYELNEYGLHAAYSFLGISNQAYILRADLDTAALIPSDLPPNGPPVNGTYWFDTGRTNFGLFQSNGNAVPGLAWQAKTVKVAYAADTTLVGSELTPKGSFGSNGDFAVAVGDNNNFFFEKVAGSWLHIGSNEWKSAHPTIVRGVTTPSPVISGNTFVINGTVVTLSGTTVNQVVIDINNASITNITAALDNGALSIRNTAGGNITITAGTGTPLTALGITPKLYKGVSVSFTNDASYPNGSVAGDLWVKGTSTNNGSDWFVKVYNATTGLWERKTVPFYPFNSALSDGNVGKDAAAVAALSPVTGTIYVGYDASTGVKQLRRFGATAFAPLVYEASVDAPVTDAVDGALWFSDDFAADIMVSNGSNWLGYINMYPDTNPAGVFLQGSMPTVQSDGTALVDNDLWIDTTDLENYPRLYRYNATSLRWVLVDTTDQTSPFGVLFADARQDSGVAFTGQATTGYGYNSAEITDMLTSDYVDPDAPDARTVPMGMLLFNTRYSTYNVKEWRSNYFGLGGYSDTVDYSQNTYHAGGTAYTFPALDDKGRWVTISGNRTNGSPLMGRRAQRAVITKKMAEAVVSSADARSEVINFNLIAAPGYPELIDEMIALNVDRKNTAFVVGDTPIRLKPTGTDLENWANNAYGAASNGEDGLTTSSPYVGVYYPWGLGDNIDGSEVMIPPSTMALRTIAYNDQVAYPWFAPAGFSRGLVSNATSTGYLSSEGEYVPSLLGEGLRNVLYLNKMNPITFIQNRGLVVFGQKTRAPVASAIDRVNVARLCNYIASALDALAKPFLFEQNDQQTRDTFKAALIRFLANLMGLRAITDFAVVCDSSNNTQERINRNELWADVLILPTKAVEFIMIPIRLENQAV